VGVFGGFIVFFKWDLKKKPEWFFYNNPGAYRYFMKHADIHVGTQP